MFSGQKRALQNKISLVPFRGEIEEKTAYLSIKYFADPDLPHKTSLESCKQTGLGASARAHSTSDVTRPAYQVTSDTLAIL